jgi:hypothetical protein
MPSATYKCKLSGQTVTFTQQVDIDSMEDHPEYELVEYLEDKELEEKESPAAKKMGRPKKVVSE